MPCPGFQWIKKLFGRDSCLLTLAHLLCLSVFLVQLIKLIPAYISPTMTYTVVENKPLRDMEFPLDIKICVKPILDSTVLRSYGYTHPSFYSMGVFDELDTSWLKLCNCRSLSAKDRLDHKTILFRNKYVGKKKYHKKGTFLNLFSQTSHCK